MRLGPREEQNLTTQRARRRAAESAEEVAAKGRRCAFGGFVTAQAGGLTVRTKGRTDVGGTKGWNEAIGCRAVGGALGD